MESSTQIEAQALEWLAKRDSGRWSEVDQAAFSEWIRVETAHRIAYLRLEAGWERTARLKAFGAGMKPGIVPPPGEWRTFPFFRLRPASRVRSALKARIPKIAGSMRTLKTAAIAASILVAVGLGAYATLFRPGESYTTPIGVIASIPLEDGSKITLNTQSKLRVALTQTERRIELQSGEAYFDVAKDPARPFVVDAGDKRIVAVGTRFSVRREANEVQVVVTEGSVRFEAEEGGTNELLSAGSVLRTTHASHLVRNKSPLEAEEALSWRSGYLIFDDTALADAVAEFNRYSKQRIVIEDPQLAAIRINGKFRSTNAHDFVQLLRNGFGIQVSETGETVTLRSR